MIRKPIWKIYPVNSWPEILLLLLKALISISAPSSPTRTYKLSIEFFNRFIFDNFMLSTGLKLAPIPQKF